MRLSCLSVVLVCLLWPRLSLGSTLDDVKDLHFAEAYFYAQQGLYFDALKRLDMELLQHYAKAIKLWKKAADKGNPMAHFFLGYMYETGSGVKRDVARARKFYSGAAKKGNLFANQAMKVLK